MEFKVDENIVLRSFTVDDAEERYDIIDKNREFLKKWLGWLDFYHSKQDVIDFTKVCLNNEKNNISLPLAIYYDGKFAGSIELKDLDFRNRLLACKRIYRKRNYGKNYKVYDRLCI